MTYLDAVTRVQRDLRDGGGLGPVQAAFQLAVLAWQALEGQDPAWDRFGLEVLDVGDQLYPVPDVVVDGEPPDADTPEVRAAVRSLVLALAAHLEDSAADDDRALAAHLADSAAAARLRDAAADLP